MSFGEIDPYELLCVGPFRASSAYITVTDREAVADYAARLSKSLDEAQREIAQRDMTIDGLRQQVRDLGGAA